MRQIIALVLLATLASASLETIMLRKGLGKELKDKKKITPTKTEAAGGWTPLPNDKLLSANDDIVIQAEAAVNTKYNPQANGFTFKRVLAIQTQVVAGVNYDLYLEYTNSEGQIQVYDVILYIVPWNPSANQVVKCNLVDQVSI
ncbi:hypothetical protein pb186bvf_000610 [Paramecium bursaria]